MSAQPGTVHSQEGQETLLVYAGRRLMSSAGVWFQAVSIRAAGMNSPEAHLLLSRKGVRLPLSFFVCRRDT